MASNSQTQIDALEYVGIDVSTGINHPAVGVRQSFTFGWNGSGSRSSNSLPAITVKPMLTEELIALAAAGTTDSVTANLLPANSLIGMVLGRVTVTTTTAVTFSVGDPTTAQRFAGGVSLAANTTFVGLSHWSGAVTTLAAGPSQAADAKIRITPNATPGNANGRIALQVWSITGVPPTA